MSLLLRNGCVGGMANCPSVPWTRGFLGYGTFTANQDKWVTLCVGHTELM